MDVQTAFSIFLQSFTEVPSRRNVSTQRLSGTIPVIHSNYIWQGEQVISDDFFILGCSPTDALTAVSTYRPVKNHCLLVVDDQPGLKARYEALGYTLSYIEYLMARPLIQLPLPENMEIVKRVQTAHDMARANAGDAEIEPWVRPDNLQETLPHYFIEQDNLVVARARNWYCSPGTSYVTHVFTHPSYRRRGLARTVMLRLLWDCLKRGETASVLVASESGDLLYRSLGYERLATLLVFHPSKHNHPYNTAPPDITPYETQ